MIRKILRCLNEAKYGPLPEKVKPKQENTGLKHAQTATVAEFNNLKETQWDDMFNIGDVCQLKKYLFAQCSQTKMINQFEQIMEIQDILINKNFVVDTKKYCVNQFNKMKRVEYVTLNSDKSIINIYFEDYMKVPTVNWQTEIKVTKPNSFKEKIFNSKNTQFDDVQPFNLIYSDDTTKKNTQTELILLFFSAFSLPQILIEKIQDYVQRSINFHKDRIFPRIQNNTLNI